MKILLSNKTYDVLKWVCLIGLPALAALVAAVGEIWHIPNVTQIVLTEKLQNHIQNTLLRTEPIH